MRTLALSAGLLAFAIAALPGTARAEGSREKLPGVFLLGGAFQLGDRGGANAIFRSAGTPELPALVPRFGFGVNGALASGLALGFDFIFDYWRSGESGLLGVTMGPSAGWVFFTSDRLTVTSQAGLAFGASRLSVHGGLLFQPAPNQGLSFDGPRTRSGPRAGGDFAGVVADPGIAAMFQSISLTAFTALALEYGDWRKGGPFAGGRLGFQVPVVREDWNLNFERHVGAAPNVPHAGAYFAFVVGWRFSAEALASVGPPPRRP